MVTGKWSGTATSAVTGGTHKYTFNVNARSGKQGSQMVIKGAGQATGGKYEVVGLLSQSGWIAFAKAYEHRTFLYRGMLREQDSGLYLEGHFAGLNGHGIFGFVKS